MECLSCFLGKLVTDRRIEKGGKKHFKSLMTSITSYYTKKEGKKAFVLGLFFVCVGRGREEGGVLSLQTCFLGALFLCV